MNANDSERPHYQEGVQYEFEYDFKVSESLQLKNDPQNKSSDAGFIMIASVAVAENNLAEGGLVKMYVGFEPADDSLIEEDQEDEDETQETLLFYVVELDQDHKVHSITGLQGSLKEDNLRYLLTFIEQLTPHIKSDTEDGRNLRDVEMEELIKRRGQVNSRGVEIPLYTHDIDLEGRDVYTITVSNDNLIYPSAAMQSKPGFATPKYLSFEKVTIDKDRTLLSDQKNVEFVVGDQDQDDDVTLRARIYQVTRVAGKLRLLHKSEIEDTQLSQMQDLFKDKITKTVSQEQVEKLLLYPQEVKMQQEEGATGPRHLLSLEQIQTRATSHYPSDFSETENNFYIYKKDIVNMKILGHRVQGGVYAAAGYSYKMDSDKLGGFASAGAGAYVSSTVYSNDWYYFLTGGTIARFEGDKVIFKIGQLKDQQFTELSYSKTLDNPWPELSEKILSVFSQESTLVQKFQNLVDQVLESQGISQFQVPSQFQQFVDKCTDIRTMYDVIFTDQESLHFDQCFDLLIEATNQIIEQLDQFIQQSSNETLVSLAQDVKSVGSDLLALVESVRSIVSAFKGDVKSIFNSLSLPIQENISHLNEEKILFSVCWPVWIVSVCVEAKSKQDASSSVDVNVMKLKAEAGPKYQATIELEGSISILIARAGVKVEGVIAAAQLGNQVKQRDNTNLAQSFKVGINSCLKSSLNVRAVQANIKIFYSYKTLKFSCSGWWCSFKLKWKDKTIADWPLLKDNAKSIELINNC